MNRGLPPKVSVRFPAHLCRKRYGIVLNSLAVSTIMKEQGSAVISEENLVVIVAYDPFRTYSIESTTEVLSPEILLNVKVLNQDC